MSGRSGSFYGVASLGDEQASVNGIELKSHSVWRGMLKRCYCPIYKEKFPSYNGCEVHKDWLEFKAFREWHDNNYRNGFHLDKDLIKRGNKVYSKDHCAYVPLEINAIVLDCKRSRGDLPQGVKLEKRNGTYTAGMGINNKQVHLGTFKTAIQAFNAYKKAKENRIKLVAEEYFNKGAICKSVYESLINWKIELCH